MVFASQDEALERSTEERGGGGYAGVAEAYIYSEDGRRSRRRAVAAIVKLPVENQDPHVHVIPHHDGTRGRDKSPSARDYLHKTNDCLPHVEECSATSLVHQRGSWRCWWPYYDGEFEDRRWQKRRGRGKSKSKCLNAIFPRR